VEARVQLRQTRDDWHEIVRAKYSPADIQRLESVVAEDLNQISAEIRSLADLVLGAIQNGTMNRQDAANVASTMVSSIAAPPSRGYPHPGYIHAVDDVSSVSGTPLPLPMLSEKEGNESS
jgi:hypothetical protein